MRARPPSDQRTSMTSCCFRRPSLRSETASPGSASASACASESRGDDRAPPAASPRLPGRIAHQWDLRPHPRAARVRQGLLARASSVARQRAAAAWFAMLRLDAETVGERSLLAHCATPPRLAGRWVPSTWPCCAVGPGLDRRQPVADEGRKRPDHGGLVEGMRQCTGPGAIRPGSALKQGLAALIYGSPTRSCARCCPGFPWVRHRPGSRGSGRSRSPRAGPRRSHRPCRA